MAAKLYEMTLRRRQKRVKELDPFTRSIDLTEPRFVDEFDGLMVHWLCAAIRRTGNDEWSPRRDLDDFDLEVREQGNPRVAFVFAASNREAI